MLPGHKSSRQAPQLHCLQQVMILNSRVHDLWTHNPPTSWLSSKAYQMSSEALAKALARLQVNSLDSTHYGHCCSMQDVFWLFSSGYCSLDTGIFLLFTLKKNLFLHTCGQRGNSTDERDQSKTKGSWNHLSPWSSNGIKSTKKDTTQ